MPVVIAAGLVEEDCRFAWPGLEFLLNAALEFLRALRDEGFEESGGGVVEEQVAGSEGK